MSVPILTKMNINGYDVLSVNHGPWRVCTNADRFGSFRTREEAFAFAATLPMRVVRTKRLTSAQ
ncbi:DUF2188 domain-containing protein [Pseudomonas sp. AU8050]|uniref:DUF2188 domain-containing protein n=1 Tax=Pseudomonas sp. AU8050 TaxID=2681497 RepID=UPI001409D850|nr:DUF2188 domain-containing protein [Pseudomonas sp. AU8050]